MTLRIILILIGFSIGTVLASPSCGQQPECPNCFVPLVMRNAQGELAHDYSPKDVTVKIDGIPVAVDEIHGEQRLRRIVIVLDASGSMKDSWRHAVSSGSIVASLAEGHARLALLIFNDKVVEQIGFDRGNSAVEERLKDLQNNGEFAKTSVHGGSAINDAIASAIVLLVDPTTADSIYVVSDGHDNKSHTDQWDIKQKLSASGIRVFADVLRQWNGSGRVYQSELLGTGPDFQDLAQLTGGASIQADPTETKLSFPVRPKSSVIEAAHLFFAAMFDNEVLQFSWTNLGTNKRDMKISISETGKDHVPGMQLFYPRQLYACASKVVPAH